MIKQRESVGVGYQQQPPQLVKKEVKPPPVVEQPAVEKQPRAQRKSKKNG